jgi:hypothetical protein
MTGLQWASSLAMHDLVSHLRNFLLVKVAAVRSEQETAARLPSRSSRRGTGRAPVGEHCYNNGHQDRAKSQHDVLRPVGHQEGSS